MQPLQYDVRSYYRKTAVGTEEHDGIVTETFETTGPFDLAFVPGAETRMLSEQGYVHSGSQYLVIADGCGSQDTASRKGVFRAGDILTDGEEDLYEIISVRTFPTEQTMTAREVTNGSKR